MLIKFAGLLTAVVSLGIAQAVSAADLPVKAPIYKAPAAAPAYNWSGCYVGAQAGYAWDRDKPDETLIATGATSIFSPTDTARPSGAKLGGILGCNGNWPARSWSGSRVMPNGWISDEAA